MMLGSRPQSRKTVHGTVTKLFENFGYVNDEIFFMRTVVSGGQPRVGDRVVATANHTPNMPVKWNAESVALEGRQKSTSSFARSERSSDRRSRSRDDRGQAGRRSGGRTANYVVNIPHRLFSLRQLSVMELRQRYPRLHLPSEFFHAANGWQEFFPLERPFRLGCEVKYHVFPKEVDSLNWQEAMEAPDADDHDYRYSAKVMLLASPPLSELYRRTCELAQERPNSRERFTSLSKMLQFLCGFSGEKSAEPLAFGGPWSPSLDGENVEENPQVLVNTAIRHVRRQIGLDLSGCTTWYKFTEFHYYRQPRTDKDKQKDPTLETVVMFFPDVWNLLPSEQEWTLLKQKVQERMDCLLFPKEPTPDPTENQADESAADGDADGEGKPDADGEPKPEASADDESKLETSVAESDKQETPGDVKISAQDVQGMKVADLRKELERRGLDSKGLKAQLVARLQEAMADEAPAGDTEAGGSDANEESAKSSERVSPLSEQEQQRIRRQYQLPDTPSILVNPSRTAKGGKLQCQSVSLAQLLTYRLDASKERTFEVSLFAEQFNEMLTRDCAFNIYAALATGAEEPPAKKAKTETGDSEDTSDDSTGVTRTVRPGLLLSFVFFDREHAGHLLCKDIEELVLTLGLLHSRSQVRKWVESLGERRSHEGLVLRYRSLTDKQVRLSESNGLVGYVGDDEIPAESLRRLLAGNKTLVDAECPQVPDVESAEQRLRRMERACAATATRQSQCATEVAGLGDRKEAAESRRRSLETENEEMRQKASSLAEEEAAHRDGYAHYRELLQTALDSLTSAKQPFVELFEKERQEAERLAEEKRKKEEEERRQREEERRLKEEEERKRREAEEEERKRKEEEEAKNKAESGDVEENKDVEMKEEETEKSGEWSVVDAV